LEPELLVSISVQAQRLKNVVQDQTVFYEWDRRNNHVTGDKLISDSIADWIIPDGKGQELVAS